MLLALKMEEGTPNQGMQVASRSWKMLGNRFSPRLSRKEHSPADILILAHSDLCWTSNVQKYKIIICVVLSH